MKTIYVTGHRTFSNRGCEAIVRSTVAAIRMVSPNIRFLVPSDDILRDAAQWPDAADHGIEFVKAYISPYTRPWVHAQRLPIFWLKRLGWPFPFPHWVRKQLSLADLVLSVGGDNYSLDYRLPSPLMGLDGLAIRLGKPTVLWGASVGPFEKEPAFVQPIREHLSRFDLLGVRETVSYEYLTSGLGLSNVMPMVDPAFGLKKERVDSIPFWPTALPNGVLGLNVSPLIERYTSKEQDLQEEVIVFIRRIVETYKLNVLLIPHVVPLDGSAKNSDSHYMETIFKAVLDQKGAVSMCPPWFNAAQVKEVISGLRFFIGARTHSTIAALSTGIPSISISYSVKARGINRDLFGHEALVLPTHSLSAQSLEAGVRYLLDHESGLRQVLAKRIPACRNTLSMASERIMRLIHG